MYFIIVKFSFVHYHFWPDAPEEYAYLRHPHRHEFFVTVKRPVRGPNREIEVNALEENLRTFCLRTWGRGGSTDSCEMIAQCLAQYLAYPPGLEVTVLEDNLQGGGYYCEHDATDRLSAD